MCNPGSTTTKNIAKMMNLEKEWYTPEEFTNSVVAPRSNCVLNTDKLMKVYPMPSLHDSLKDCIKKYK